MLYRHAPPLHPPCCRRPPLPPAGLVDAVTALQARNRLLQKDLDTLKLKYTGGAALRCK